MSDGSNKGRKGLYIPPEIFGDDRLNANQKIYMAYYIALEKNILATDKIMEKSLSSRTILSIKNYLEKIGLIEPVVDYKKAKDLVLERKGIGFSCEWCGTRTCAIVEHHFPIPKKDGGTEVVKICPNCHMEFHMTLKGSLSSNEVRKRRKKTKETTEV
jgi:hypothetical protein